MQRGILKAVVHHDDARAGRHRGLRAGDAVARHEGGSDTGEQERLVTHVERRGAAPDRPAADL